MSSESLYSVIYQKILDSIILSSEYPENSPLPSERFLSNQYHVSRSTIRQALEKLQDDGHIYTIHGNGSFKKPQIFELDLSKFYSFTDELKNNNVLIHNDIIDYRLIQLDKALSSRLGFSEGSDFHKLVRLRSAKEYPLMLETTYLPKSRFHRINPDVLADHGSLYAYLREKYDFLADRAIETFRPILASAKEQNLLQISSNVPCMFLERFSYEDEVISEYTQSIVRGDKYIFKAILPNPHSR